MRKHFRSLVVFLLASVCPLYGEDATTGDGVVSKEVEETTEVEKEAEEMPRVVVATSLGDFTLALDREKAPVTVANFLKYVEAGHYHQTVFHRVIDGFMIQGGGFSMVDDKLTEKPTGAGIENEGQNGLKNLTGTVAMARTNDPNSATAQFFINVADNPALDYPSNGGYAVFGKVVEGMEVVDKIRSVETKQSDIVMLNPTTGKFMEIPAGDVPVDPVVIESIEVVK